MASIGLPVLDV